MHKNIIEHPLEFERPLVELEKRLIALADEITAGNESLKPEYERLVKEAEKLKKDIYLKLTPYQRVQLSRHFDRPLTLDYINLLMEGFVEFHGDRRFKDDSAIVGGVAKFEGNPIMVIGHQRGKTMNERLKRNFGMPQPEGYRKALRLFRMAEKFAIPIITFIDTQGAYPGLGAEERGQAEAIARNLEEMASLTVPTISVVIGEGGSGGALALGVTDRILMLENASYSVITPEGCASILWHSKGDNPLDYAPIAAESLKITANDLLQFGIIDDIVAEPEGGAHWNFEETAINLAEKIRKHLNELSDLTVAQLLEDRYNKYRAIGEFEE